MIRYAILAGLMLFSPWGEYGRVDPPVAVRFSLSDGAQLSGHITKWDADGFDGTFGRREWIDLDRDDVWDVYQKVMDEASSAQWLNLGRIMLLMAEGDKKIEARAQRAFRKAVLLDPNAQESVDEVKSDVAESMQRLQEEKQQAKADRLTTVSPEGREWSADPWPELSEDEQRAAVLAMRADAEEFLKRAGISVVPVETQHFLLYTDRPRAEAAQLIIRLERIVPAVRKLLGKSEDASSGFRGFHGKAIVFVFNESDTFHKAEADAFGHLVPRSVLAVCHPLGPKVLINARFDKDVEAYRWAVVHEAVHGVMHRWETPRRLPPWANEGLADYITAQVLAESHFGSERRDAALRFFRNNGDVTGLMSMEYANERWHQARDTVEMVGGLIVELMIAQEPLRFRKWVESVKRGREWTKMLKKDFGATSKELADTTARYYMVND